ncbi:type II secretion system F family protein [Elioraea sp. Yellowstone]|jgi:tight adherence protein C|uniref:type II secretion system F family protein n=1 Tax=Elioraea sp. Yellowstone TaxID=2592070 RepID=UPI00115408B5|nr:type II secretion system F family protein [Elioraea sp. Yellowstone]TQF76755.1 type II secretion system F family protein [Elioraea sp. Yellowstone]
MSALPEFAGGDPLLALAVLATAVLILVLIAAWLSARAGIERRLAGRVASLGRGALAAERKPAGPGLIQGALRAIGTALGGSALLSEKDRRELERSVAAAGYRPQSVVPVVIGLKVVLLVVVPLAVYGMTVLRGTTGATQMVLVGVGVVAGLLGPNWVLGWMHKRYVRQIRTGLADTLDLMVICAEAGLGLESMVERVAIEMAPSNRPIAAEFMTLSNELRMLSDRRQALLNLGERTDVVGLRRLATTLAQTIQYGTPLGQALRTLSAEMRQERLIEFEEKAARLPALLVLPLTLFILPCLVMLLAGPSFVLLLASFNR